MVKAAQLTKRAKLATAGLAKLAGRLAKLAARLTKLAKRLTSPTSKLAVLGQIRQSLRARAVTRCDGERRVAVLHPSNPKNAATLAPVETVVVVVASRALVTGALTTPTTMAALNHGLWGAEGMGIR